MIFQGKTLGYKFYTCENMFFFFFSDSKLRQ